ncbi:hypothetical protein BGX34_011144 [Mortierella sp. NVP85]|nr:hypothetical protein BGX34_011144 [Mortierella sp. NVP85]
MSSGREKIQYNKATGYFAIMVTFKYKYRKETPYSFQPTHICLASLQSSPSSENTMRPSYRFPKSPSPPTPAPDTEPPVDNIPVIMTDEVIVVEETSGYDTNQAE